MISTKETAINLLRDAYIQVRNGEKKNYLEDIEEAKKVLNELPVPLKDECTEQIEFLNKLLDNSSK